MPRGSDISGWLETGFSPPDPADLIWHRGCRVHVVRPRRQL